MIDAGWSRPSERIVLEELDLLEVPGPYLDDLQQAVDSGYMMDRGIEAWRETGYRDRIGFRLPAQVPCVTALGRAETTAT